MPRYARLVPLAEIADPKNDFNLNLPRYIDSTEPEDLQDIDGAPARRHPRARPRRAGRLLAGAARRARRAVRVRRPPRLRAPEAAAPDLKAAILGHAEFAAFNQTRRPVFADWRGGRTAAHGLRQDGHPKALIDDLAEDLLAAFARAAARRLRRLPAPDGLLGRDDAGRRLPDRRRRLGGETCRILETDKKGKTKDKGWTCDLVPKALHRRALLRDGAGRARRDAGRTGSCRGQPRRTGGGARR